MELNLQDEYFFNYWMGGGPECGSEPGEDLLFKIK
jgi:hypothetical protein